MQNRTIAVDARPLAREMSGIRRYTEELLKILVNNKHITWLLYSDREIQSDHWLVEKENVQVYVIPCHRGARYLWPLYSMRWLYRHKPDIFWSPRQHLPVSTPKGTILFLTIHDLVWMESRETMPFLAYMSEWLLSRHSIGKADYILAVSETTRNKINQKFKPCDAPIRVITNGYNPPEVSCEPKMLRAMRTGDFFLAVGTHEPRKNYAALISAYYRYVDSGGRKALLIAGNRGWSIDIEQLIQASGKIKNRVVNLQGISDHELRWCYEHASALVSASLNEGFGIPLIEAQYFGVPLIVSDIEPYREIAGPEATYFDPLNEETIMQALLESDRTREPTKRKASTKKYSWEASSSKLVALFLGSVQDSMPPQTKS